MVSIRCLLVDDCEEFKNFLVVFLTEQLPRLEIVGNVDDAEASIGLAERLGPDLVLMDWSIGKMSGLEATRRLKIQSPACRVVLLSGNSGVSYLEAALAAGAHGFIAKTDIYEQLVPLIRQMFG
jgi:DNA-binding NarL/FixJ family response regulator